LQKRVSELIEKNEEQNYVLIAKMAEKEKEMESMKVKLEIYDREREIDREATKEERERSAQKTKILEEKYESLNQSVMNLADRIVNNKDKKRGVKKVEEEGPISEEARKLCKKHIAGTILRGVGHAEEMILNTNEI
jgi:hypothetical protein